MTYPQEDESGRPLRADARRNHDALIEAAISVFAEAGVDAPIKDIAERAGVGIGTLYRRFPTRAELIVAVFRHEVDGCADAAPLLAAQAEPFEAVALWIQRFLNLIVTKRGLAGALHSSEPAYTSLASYFEERLVPVLQGLLDAAGREIRADASASDLLRAVGLLCPRGAAGDVAQTRRMVALLVNGLRVPTRC
jgi:AcrR family transcriptional regulator